MANKAKQEIAASGGQLGGDGMATAAKIISIVALVLTGLLVLFVVGLWIIGLIGAVASSTAGY